MPMGHSRTDEDAFTGSNVRRFSAAHTPSGYPNDPVGNGSNRRNQPFCPENVRWEFLSLRQFLVANSPTAQLSVGNPFGFKRFWQRRANHRDRQGGHFRSLTASRLFPSEPRANWFAFKTSCIFSGLSECRKRTFCGASLARQVNREPVVGIAERTVAYFRLLDVSSGISRSGLA